MLRFAASEINRILYINLLIKKWQIFVLNFKIGHGDRDKVLTADNRFRFNTSMYLVGFSSNGCRQAVKLRTTRK